MTVPDVTVELTPGSAVVLGVDTPTIDLTCDTPAVVLEVATVVQSTAALDDLTDVTVTSPAEFDSVMFDGSGWVNQPTQRARTIVVGANVGQGGDIVVPDGTSFVFIFGSVDSFTLPSAVTNDGQMLTVYSLAGATMTVATDGVDFIMPPGPPSTTVDIGDGGVVEFSALDLTGIVGAAFWIPGVRSGSDYNIPYWLGQGNPDGYVVALASGMPAWVDVNGLVDIGTDPPWTVETVTTKVMRLDYAGNPGNTDGAWSTAEPADLTSGVDLRAQVWFDYPSDVTGPSTDRYMEILTQEHPTASGGDTFEAAILWADDTFGTGVIEGHPHSFWEAAKSGVGSGSETNGGWTRGGLVARQWVTLRWTQDFATDTVTYWRAVPFEVSADCEQVDGTWFYPISTMTNADFSGIDTTATSDWWIGLRYTGYLAWMKMTSFDGATTYVDINTTDLDALTLGATSFTDDAGNTWTTVAGGIVAP